MRHEAAAAQGERMPMSKPRMSVKVHPPELAARTIGTLEWRTTLPTTHPMQSRKGQPARRHACMTCAQPRCCDAQAPTKPTRKPAPRPKPMQRPHTAPVPKTTPAPVLLRRPVLIAVHTSLNVGRLRPSSAHADCYECPRMPGVCAMMTQTSTLDDAFGGIWCTCKPSEAC